MTDLIENGTWSDHKARLVGAIQGMHSVSHAASDNPTLWLLFAIEPMLWLPLPPFFLVLVLGDYSFGQALKSTVGRGSRA